MPPKHSPKPDGICARQSTFAFSVLETVVVIAMLAIVITLILPLGGVMREQSNRVRCVANLRNIGVATNLYAAENNGWLPFPYSGQYPFVGNKNGLGGDLRMQGFIRIIPYLSVNNPLGVIGTFRCPSSAIPLSEMVKGWTSKPNHQSSYNQYCGWGPDGGNSGHYPNSSDRLGQKGRSQLLFIDLTTRASTFLSNHRDSNHAALGGNALFLNGEVRWIPVEKLTLAR